MQSASAPDRLLTEREAAQFLGVAPGTLRVARSTGPLPGRIWLPFIRLGRSIRYDPHTLHQWLAARVVSGEVAR